MINFAQIGIISSHMYFAKSFLITGYELDITNDYVDVSFDPDVYHSTGGGLIASDLQIANFQANGGNSLTITITSVTTTAGSSLSGGENTVRVNISITGGPTGVETFEIKASASAVYRSSSFIFCFPTDTTGAITLYEELDPMYKAAINYFQANSITPPTTSQRAVDNQLFTIARSNGWLTELDMLYLFTSNSAASRFEFVSGTYLGTYTGTVTIEQFLGGLASTNGRFNTNWIPNNGVKYLQNDASLIGVVGNNGQASQAMAGVRGRSGSGADFGRTKLTPRTTSSTTTVVVNTNTSGNNITASSITNSEGVFHMTRNAGSGSNAEKLYINGVDKGSSTAASSLVSDNQLYGWCENNNGTATASNETHKLMLLATGSALRSLTSTINTDLTTWKDATKLLVTPSNSGRLYSWIGQSNMGRSDVLSTLTSGEAADYNAGPISIANGYDANFYIWWNDAWQLLESGVNGYTSASNQFSPLVPFAVAETIKYPGEDLFCVFEVVGGTSLAVDWLPPSGARYASYKSKYNNAKATLTVTHYMPVYWGQGEKDSQTSSYASAYEANEQTLFTAIFANTGHTIGIVMQVNINIATTYVSTIQTAKDNNLAANVYSASGDLIDVDDLPVHDGFHLSVTDCITFAQRMSSAYP